VKKRKDKLEVELLEARALSVSATRNVERLERYDGEGASEDEEEGKLRSGWLGISRRKKVNQNRLVSEFHGQLGCQP